MAELREVFEMTTKQVEPDRDSWRKQEERHHRTDPQEKLGALAWRRRSVAVVAAVGVVSEPRPRGRGAPTARRPPPPGRPPTSSRDLRRRLPRRSPDRRDRPRWRASVCPGPRRFTRWNRSDRVQRAKDHRRRCRRDGRATIDSTTGGGLRAPRWSPDGSDDRVPSARPRSRKSGILFAVDLASGEVTRAHRPRARSAWASGTCRRASPRRWIGPVHESSSLRLPEAPRPARTITLVGIFVGPGVRQGADAHASRRSCGVYSPDVQHDRLHADLGRRRALASGSRTRTEAIASNSSTANSTRLGWSPDGTRSRSARLESAASSTSAPGVHEGRGSRRCPSGSTTTPCGP